MKNFGIYDLQNEKWVVFDYLWKALKYIEENGLTGYVWYRGRPILERIEKYTSQHASWKNLKGEVSQADIYDYGDSEAGKQDFEERKLSDLIKFIEEFDNEDSDGSDGEVFSLDGTSLLFYSADRYGKLSWYGIE